jgi:uncharacterized protein YaeQ
MNKRVPFTVKDEGAVDSVFHWKQKYDESVDKWIRLDSTLTKVIRESEEKDKQIAFLKDSHDAMRELAYKTGAQEEREACAKECEIVWDSRAGLETGTAFECAATIRARGKV